MDLGSSNLYMVPEDNTIPYKAPKPRNIVEISQHRASIVYRIQCVSKLIRYLHAVAGFPVKEMWIAAIEKGRVHNMAGTYRSTSAEISRT